MAKKITSAKRVGRNANRPTNKRYVSNKVFERNRDRRKARIAKRLAKAKAHQRKPDAKPTVNTTPAAPLIGRKLDSYVASTARYARAVSKTIARLEERYPTNNEEFVNQLNAVYRSPANQHVNHRLRRLRRTIFLAR